MGQGLTRGEKKKWKIFPKLCIQTDILERHVYFVYIVMHCDFIDWSVLLMSVIGFKTTWIGGRWVGGVLVMITSQ